MGFVAQLPCCTLRGTGHVSCLHPGMAAECEGGCAARGAQGCPSEKGPRSQGAACWGRDSAAGQGKCCACLESSNSRVGRSCGWKKQLAAGQGPSADKRVLCGLGLLTAPDHPQDISEGTFQGQGQSRAYYKPEKLSCICVFCFLLLGNFQEKWKRSCCA